MSTINYINVTRNFTNLSKRRHSSTLNRDLGQNGQQQSTLHRRFWYSLKEKICAEFSKVSTACHDSLAVVNFKLQLMKASLHSYR